ncbi:putative U3 small nucleolar ribonucleoprotein complex, subunit Mpp10 [Helianthus annuus]|nr:putative U3 small nucleolar ribonucleoprotein complex, subunit Mpp10 [Helianthus annuus]KAJ0516987.1 putative U3 small nucleolar ribonucleoprotein complex, subunit Mpp10 [Helianthus annuus]KAJ0684995.1 putative U3 small nucleolar ribonucleoprotein complex, subunit Mpp10 [Helianthus annuus]KAJ0688922.1 putative U3 small nucleolar ribonucleoprotein complex, subunit Mpp10 [Helianthus annuus]
MRELQNQIQNSNCNFNPPLSQSNIVQPSFLKFKTYSSSHLSLSLSSTQKNIDSEQNRRTSKRSLIRPAHATLHLRSGLHSSTVSICPPFHVDWGFSVSQSPSNSTIRSQIINKFFKKNSALGEDLDWERNVKPPPVITEEVSQSIEELIMKRISEGHFDDVQKLEC